MSELTRTARPAREVLAWSRELVEPALRHAVDTLPPPIRRIAGYHFGWWDADGKLVWGGGGKAIRPALALLAAEACGGDPAAARPAAVAVELVHDFSLVHDDVIDGDLTRRHRPTVWTVFGTGAAILAGGALQALAADVLVAGGHPAGPAAVRQLAAATLDLLAGQHADLAFEERGDVTLPECLGMARDKSAALMGGACRLGATFAGATTAQAGLLREFGEQLGLAFQLADDLLGIWGNPAVTGKPVAADLRRRKKSLPVVAALTSGSRAGEELARLYRRGGELSDQDAVRAAVLVAQAGGRTWCLARAEAALQEAMQALRSAVDPAGRPAAELAALARLAAYRDR